ncbi:unnamed protein product [Rotaria socialis]
MGPKSRRQRHAITTSTRYLLNRSGNNAEDDAEREEMEVDDIEYEQQPMNFTDRITSDNIADLFELCKYKCPVKYLSVLIYATLRSFGHSWENCDTFLRTIGALKAQTAHRWADVFLKGDVEEFQGENRGGKHMAEFYDYFPDLEDAAREFTIRRCSEKAADFTAIDLANFIDKEYYLTTNTSKGIPEGCREISAVGRTVRTNLPAAGVQGGLQEPFHRDRRRQRQDTYCQVTHRLRLQQGHWHEVPSRQDRLHRLQGKSKSSALQVSGRRAQRQDEGAD